MLDNWIWIVSRKFSLLRREYLSSAVKFLIKILKSESFANRQFFRVYLANSTQKVWFLKSLGRLTCSLWKGGLKRAYPNISLTMPLTVYSFGNKLASNVISFPKCWKFDEDFKNGKKNWENAFKFLDNSIWYSTCRFQI